MTVLQSESQATREQGPYKIGLPSTTRTCDLRLRRPLLYPAELWAVGISGLIQGYCEMKNGLSMTTRFFNWSEYKDSNLGPPAPKAGALPGCATLRDHNYTLACGYLATMLPIASAKKAFSWQYRQRAARPATWQGMPRALPP